MSKPSKKFCYRALFREALNEYVNKIDTLKNDTGKVVNMLYPNMRNEDEDVYEEFCEIAQKTVKETTSMATEFVTDRSDEEELETKDAQLITCMVFLSLVQSLDFFASTVCKSVEEECPVCNEKEKKGGGIIQSFVDSIKKE